MAFTFLRSADGSFGKIYTSIKNGGFSGIALQNTIVCSTTGTFVVPAAVLNNAAGH